MTEATARRATMVVLALMPLIGCGSPPTRLSNPEAFKVVASGSVPAASASKLVECIQDEFVQSNSRNTSFSVRQQRRSDHTRIEVYVSNVSLAVSADVFDDGRAVLFKGNDVFGMHTVEPELFTRCVKRLTQNSPA